MPRRRRPLALGRYVGGPLDGDVATHTTAKWPIYRTDGGEHMPTYRGDRIFGSRGPQPLNEGYTLQEHGGETLYVHATIWRQFTRAAAD